MFKYKKNAKYAQINYFAFNSWCNASIKTNATHIHTIHCTYTGLKQLKSATNGPETI